MTRSYPKGPLEPELTLLLSRRVDRKAGPAFSVLGLICFQQHMWVVIEIFVNSKRLFSAMAKGSILRLMSKRLDVSFNARAIEINLKKSYSLRYPTFSFLSGSGKLFTQSSLLCEAVSSQKRFFWIKMRTGLSKKVVYKKGHFYLRRIFIQTSLLILS